MVRRALVARVWTRERVALTVLVLCVAAFYATYSVLRHKNFQTGGYDLGIFDQAIWHYSRFEVPADTVRGVSDLLGDHFSPILALLAPLYWLFSGGAVLLVAQAVLLAIALIPIYLFTRPRLGSLAGFCFSGAFAIYFGISEAALYDFHEVAFAVPLIAFALYFLDAGRWYLLFATLALLLLTKEDLSFLVAAFGILLIAFRQYKYGAATFFAGIGWFYLTTRLFIPSLGGTWSYWSYTELGPNLLAALRTTLEHPVFFVRTLVQPTQKLKTEVAIFAPFAALSFASPYILLTVPLLLERFLSTDPNYWGRNFHYTATISPIIAMAAADGLCRIQRVVPLRRFRWPLVAAASVLVVALNAVLIPFEGVWGTISHGSTYTLSASDRDGYRALREIPAGASVEAQNPIIPHLSERSAIYVLDSNMRTPQYVVASKDLSPWPEASYAAIEEILSRYRADGYTTIFSRGGWTVLHDPRSDGSPAVP